MSSENVQALMAEFEAAKLNDAGDECWSARALGKLLGYKDWDNFHKVVKKGIEACKNAGGDPHSHFREATEIVMAGISHKNVDDFQLTRWGAYLVAMNGDYRKERVAFAQVYFVARTQQAELIEQRLLLGDRVMARRELAMSEADFSKAMMDVAGLTPPEVAAVRAQGDKALFGKTTEEMKVQYGMVDKQGKPSKSALADRAPTVVQRGKAFAAELTKQKIHRGLRAVRPIAKAHEGHNADVRRAMLNADIIPEALPPEEDTKALERQIEREKKEAQKTLGAKRQLSQKAPAALPPEPSAPEEGGRMTPLPFGE